MRIFHYEKIYVAIGVSGDRKYFSGTCSSEELMSAMENLAGYRWNIEELAVPEGYDSEDGDLQTPDEGTPFPPEGFFEMGAGVMRSRVEKRLYELQKTLQHVDEVMTHHLGEKYAK